MTKVATVLGTTLLLLLAAPAVAQAGPLPTSPSLAFDSQSPRSGTTVTGVQTVAGEARAPEGVQRVELYVIRHNTDFAPGDPIAVITSRIPSHRMPFALEWDTSKSITGLVDLVVQMSTSTQRITKSIPAVRVPEPVAPAAPTKLAKPVAAQRVASRAAKPARLSGPAAVRPLASSVRSQAAPRPQIASLPANQASAFYRAYGRLNYEQRVPVAARPLPTVVDGQGAWPSLAGALVLLLTAAHLRRAATSPAGPRH